ncbi:MAG: S8 family serine peptidase, partial [Actinomycetota bacterium]
EQYALDRLNMRDAWAQSDGSGAVIAIIDTGIDLDHPDLKDKIVHGHDWVDDDNTPNDENGHGTHVAGSAAAIGNNALGVIGMAPEAKIMPLKVLGGDGTGNSEDIADAIRWAVNHGADVINLSLGGTSDLLGRIYNKVDPSNDAIAYANKKGVVVVAAAGNDDTFLRAYNRETPVLVVNATNELNISARFSNFGDPRAVSAPGARILSTAPTYPTAIWPEGTEGYETLAGTSMASPHVAGIAALMVDRGVSPEDIRNAITETALNQSDDPYLGAGIVQADLAVAQATQFEDPINWFIVIFVIGLIGGAVIVWERHRNA